MLVDEYGTLVNFEEYYPFGETSFGSYAKKRYRFCGKEKDDESGMYYYGARYYSPWLCRFISVDPLAGKYVFQMLCSGVVAIGCFYSYAKRLGHVNFCVLMRYVGGYNGINS